MAVKVCVLSGEAIASKPTNASPADDLVDSPDMRLEHDQISSKAVRNGGIRLPGAEFYVDNLPNAISEQVRSQGTVDTQKIAPHLISYSAGQQWKPHHSLESQLPHIRQVANTALGGRSANVSSTTIKDICGSRLANGRQQETCFSVLAFASSGSTCIISIVETNSHANENTTPNPVSRNAERACLEAVGRAILSQEYFSALNGCLRLDIALDNRTTTIKELEIDLEPRLFSQPPSFDDLMVQQAPGGHEALLCLLITHHQQKSKGLTAKQATVRTAFDTISSQLASTFDAIAHVAVMRSIAFEFSWEGTTLDVGCGQGVFGGLLNIYNKDPILYGTDMSEAMSKAPQIERYYQSPIHIGPMEQTLISTPQTDHIACFSVFQYCPTMTFMAAVSQMFLKARKSITFDIPEVSDEYHRKLKGSNELLKPHDHLAALDRIGVPTGWKRVLFRRCLTYTEPNFNHDVYSRYVRYERVD